MWRFGLVSLALLIAASDAVSELDLTGNDWELRSASSKIQNATVPGKNPSLPSPAAASFFCVCVSIPSRFFVFYLRTQRDRI